MPLVNATLTMDYLWNPSQYGEGTAIRYDVFRLSDYFPQGVRFVSANLKPEIQLGITSGLTMTTPEPGTAIGNLALVVRYDFILPFGRVKYSVDVACALPDESIPTYNGSDRGRIAVFEHIDFRGRHRIIDDLAGDLRNGENGFWNDRISSFVVIRGVWRFYKHIGFQSPYPRDFEPGHFAKVSAVGIENDAVSSLIAL